jgi:hypothetical protein
LHFLSLDHGGKLIRDQLAWLSSSIELNIDGSLVNFDIGLSVNSKEEVFVVEISCHMGSGIDAGELTTIVGVIELNIDVAQVWLRDLDINVLHPAPVEVDFRNCQVRQVIEDDWHDDILASICTCLSE